MHLTAIEFSMGDEGATLVSGSVRSLSFGVRMSALLHKQVRVHHALITEPFVRVVEGDERQPESSEDGATRWRFSVSDVVITDGEFMYDRVYRHGTAKIFVSDIEGKVSGFGNSDSASSAVSTANLRGKLEGQAPFLLVIEAYPFQRPAYADVFLEIQQLDLAQMNRYFLPADGLELEGFLKKGRSSARIRDRRLDAKARVLYSGFDVSIHKNTDRSGLEAFFGNLFRRTKIKNQDSADVEGSPEGRAWIRRGKRESIFGFTFRGFKEAAFKIVSGDTKP